MIAPAAGLLVLTAVAVCAFVFWVTARIDSGVLQRQSALVGLGIQSKLAEIPTAQESVALWDDAVLKTRENRDKVWLDNNLGVWMYEFYGFDAVAVVSDVGTYTYTMAGGQSPAPDGLDFLKRAAEPLIDEMRQDIASGALNAYSEYPRVFDIKAVAGRPAALSVMPITSQTGAVEVPTGTEYLHIALQYLDGPFAATIESGYQLDGAAFTQSPATAAGLATYPIFDRSGRLATFFEWIPARPGREMLLQTLPVLAVAFLVAGLLVALLIRGLWSSRAKLETERMEARHHALHDSLTGLPNRLQFETHLTRDLLNRRPGTPTTALLMLDMDRFKYVNDSFGHEAGDRLICAVGQRLESLVGPADIAARLGGDEFAIIHPCRPADLSAVALADRIVGAMAKPFEINGSEVFVGVSIGVAIAEPGSEPRELTRRADIALFDAKARGRGRVQCYDVSMDARLQDRHRLEAELREAIKDSGQVSVAFQPLHSGSADIVGMEVLARWTHPTLGAISPARFIPVAESSGLIEALGDIVLRHAFTFGARWPGRRIAVNISPIQLRNPRFPERVFDLMLETGMRPVDLELEITEGILLDHSGPALETITQFREAGVRVALDDFGTGFSSLNYLKRYPVDCIKIDRSFVAQLGPSNSSTAIVQAMVALAHALDIDVTAEGVETHEQLTMLKAMGCNLFQGFLLGPPASAEEAEQRLRRAGERRSNAA